jgi:dihydrodipicolinate synthase/N-acetylneuraminate lyase
MLANFRGAPNPVPVKAALSLMGLATDAVRRPLLPLDDDARERLANLLRSLGLLELPGGRAVPEAVMAVEGAA